MLSSFVLFITLSVILGAIGLLFMRRETPNDKLYSNIALKTTGLSMAIYVASGWYAASRADSGVSVLTLLLFGVIVLPSYLAMGYMLAALLVPHTVDQHGR
jgi:hypothetical protein